MHAYVENISVWVDALGLNGVPVLPPSLIAHEQGVVIEHYYPNDHLEPHLHVYEIGNKGRGTKIGENTKPLKGQRALTPKESKVVAKYKSKIRKNVGKIRRHLAHTKYGNAYAKKR